MAHRRCRMRNSIDVHAAVFVIFWIFTLFGCTDRTSPAANLNPREAEANADKSKLSPRTSAIPDLCGVSFVDVAAERGLRYSWPEQPRPMRATEAFGCGCAAFDCDNDGWQDVLLVGDPHPALFRNLGGIRFEEITSESGLTTVEGDWTACAIGDYDGDGLLDVLLTGIHQLALYKNVDGLRFQLATDEAGFDAANHGHWGASAGFMDLDGDGWLDLVILNYVVFGPESQQYCEYRPGVRSGCAPKTYAPERGEIWRNTGRGSFELVPVTAGMDQTNGVGLVLAFIDLDRDGRMDFYIGNDGVPADFLRNLGGMRFENIAMVYGLAADAETNSISSMGADWGDFDRDGLLDLAVTNFQWRRFVVFQNTGHNYFTDVSTRTKVAAATRSRLGFGAKWTDFENDGWPDIFFVNGHVYDNAPETDGTGAEFRQPICLFRNEVGKTFADLVPAFGEDVRRTMVGRGSATVDFNNDGRVDLLAVDFEGPVMLLENRSQTNNHWLTLDLRGAIPNHFAYGAQVVAKSGDRIWVGVLSPASSYLSSSDPRIHWGLGDAAKLDSLAIRWPSGNEQVLHDVVTDQILRIEEREP